MNLNNELIYIDKTIVHSVLNKFFSNDYKYENIVVKTYEIEYSIANNSFWKSEDKKYLPLDVISDFCHKKAALAGLILEYSVEAIYLDDMVSMVNILQIKYEDKVIYKSVNGSKIYLYLELLNNDILFKFQDYKSMPEILVAN